MRQLLRIFLLLFIANTCFGAGAGLYEVGPGKTYSTPNAAINQLVNDQGTDPFTATQTIRIYTDTYTSYQNDAIIDLNERGLVPTATYRLVIEAADGNSPVLDCQTTVKYGINIHDIKYVTIDGLEVKNANWYEIFIGTNAIYDTDYIVIKNCTIHGAVNRHGICLAGDAILNGGPENCTIQDNTIYDNDNSSYSAGGITLWYGANNNTIQGNTIYNNVRGIEISNSSTGNEVKSNIIYSNTNSGIYINGGLQSPIDKNKVYNNTDWGIYLYQTSDNGVITNNIVYDNNDGIGVDRFQTGYKVYGNTVFSNTRYGVYFYYTTSTELKNNIIHDNGNYQVYCASETSFTSDYNDLFKDSGTNTGYWNGDRASLSDWQSATGQDSNSISQDPSYNDETNRDLHIISSSPCKDAGTDLSSTYNTDFDGDTRPFGTAFDIGADEYISKGQFLWLIKQYW